MNNKGFTLAELLAVIVILAVIMIVAAPNLSKQFSKKEETEQSVLEQKIENASKIYIAKYYANKVVECSKPGSTNCTIKFTLTDLEKDGLINLSKNSSCTSDDKTKPIKVDLTKDSIAPEYTGFSNKCHG